MKYYHAGGDENYHGGGVKATMGAESAMAGYHGGAKAAGGYSRQSASAEGYHGGEKS